MSGNDRIQYPTPVYHPETDLINQAAELAGFKDPSEYLPLKMVNFLGLLLEIVRKETETVRLARVIALFYGLPTAHLPQLSKRDLELVPIEPTEMTEPCV